MTRTTDPEPLTVYRGPSTIGIYGQDAYGTPWSSFGLEGDGPPVLCERCGAAIRAGYVGGRLFERARYLCVTHVQVVTDES